MGNLSPLLQGTTVTTVNKYLNTTVTIVGNKYKLADCLYDDLKPLLNQDPKWKPWYCKRFHELGKDEVLKLASIAKADGLNPPRLFSHLLGKPNATSPQQ